MPLTPLLRLNVCAALRRLLLLLLCSSSVSCFRNNKWENCSSVNRCANFSFSYPFGKKNSGCGDHDFQLGCNRVDGHPLLTIIGTQYRILEPYILGNNTIKFRMAIDFERDKCKLLENYSQSWWYGSISFEMAHQYTNLTFWSDCNFAKNYTKKMLQLRLCGNVWYYSFIPEIESNGSLFCKMRLTLPIKKEVPLLNKSIDNQTFLSEGFEIIWHVDPFRQQNCGACLVSKGICGYNNSTPFLCYCPDGTTQLDHCPDTGGRNKPGIIRGTSAILKLGCSIGGVLLTAALAVLLFMKFYVKKRKTFSKAFTSDLRKHKRKDMEAAGLSGLKIGKLPIFSYDELCQATNCFNEENEVGDGGFGSVYIGQLGDGRSVAVKRLYQDNARRVEQFINEVMTFSNLDHPRVVRLYGCAYECSPELLLVYEFVPNGTLADHLHGHRKGPKGLAWDTRLNIAIQTAQALAFLHSLDPPIVHRDVKSSNILLDYGFNAKVADFGLSRLVPHNASHVTTAPQGTPGYVDPEYYQCYQLTEKSDVYSFGVVLAEIISGILAVDINRNNREVNLANMAIMKIQNGALHELADELLDIEMNEEVKVMVSAVAELAFSCLVSERANRPYMNEVVAQLEQIRQS